jgi:hypothetical protein
MGRIVSVAAAFFFDFFASIAAFAYIMLIFVFIITPISIFVFGSKPGVAFIIVIASVFAAYTLPVFAFIIIINLNRIFGVRTKILS